MTTEEFNTIVQAVVEKINEQVIDFDVVSSTPESTDLLSAVRPQGDGTYQGVTLKWDDIANAVTREAKGYRDEAASAKTNVENMKASVDQTVSDFNTLAEQKKAEVQGVYQNDLDELKGDLDTEMNARIEADTEHSTRLQKVEVASSVNRYEIDNLKAKSEGKLYRTETVDAEAYTVDVSSSVAPYAELQKIGGKSVVWNQLVVIRESDFSYEGITFTKQADGTFLANGTSTKNDGAYINKGDTLGFKITVNHNYYIWGSDYNGQDKNSMVLSIKRTNGYYTHRQSSNLGIIYTAVDLDNDGYGGVYYYVSEGTTLTNVKVSANVADLTLMFGAGNEPTLEECRKIFTADYYPYDIGTIKSFPVKRVKSVGKSYINTSNWDSIYTHTNGYYYGNIQYQYKNPQSFYNLSEFKVGKSYVFEATIMVKDINIKPNLKFVYTDGTSSKSSFVTTQGVWTKCYVSSDRTKTIDKVYIDYTDGLNFYVRDDFRIYDADTENTLDLSSVTSDLKSASSVHDEWSNGKIISRVGSRSYTSGDESESGYITDGTTTYYPLATPTEETVPEIDNYLQVEGGGTLTFESDETVKMTVPSTTRFVVDLTSTTEETT